MEDIIHRLQDTEKSVFNWPEYCLWWLAFIVPEGTVQAAGEEKESMVLPRLDPAYYNTDIGQVLGKYWARSTHRRNSDK